jgi:hypothetical protein
VSDNGPVTQPTEPAARSIEYLDEGGVVMQAPPPSRPARRSTSRWVPPLVGLLTFLVVLAGFGAIAGDWLARNIEMRALITQIESSESAMSALQAKVGEIATAHQDATLTDAERAAIDEDLKAAAADARDQIADAGARVAAVQWLAWHTEVGAAQQAYLAHNKAWQDYLNRAAQDPSELALPQDQVNETFAAAEAPIRAAVPARALFHLRDRVDVIFAPPPDVSGGPTQQA